MPRPDGYLVEALTATGRVQREADTVACCHCGRHVVVQGALGWCGRCGRPTCAPCAAAGRCTPLEARLTQQLTRARLHRDLGVG